MSELEFRCFIQVNYILDVFKMIPKNSDILINTFMDVTKEIVQNSDTLALD